MRMASSWTLVDATTENEQERKEKLQRLACNVWAFPRSLSRHLLPPGEDEEAFQAQVRERLDSRTAENLIAVRHRPTKALFDLTSTVDELNLSFIKRIEIDKSIVVLIDQAGACERIFSAPVPLVYTR